MTDSRQLRTRDSAAACSVLASLFGAALSSKKATTVLRPFPPHYNVDASSSSVSLTANVLSGASTSTNGVTVSTTPAVIVGTSTASSSSVAQVLDRDWTRLHQVWSRVDATVLEKARRDPEADGSAELMLAAWIIEDSRRSFALQEVAISEYDRLQAAAGWKASFPQRPQLILELVYDPQSGRDAEFRRLRAQYGSRIAFHGSALENFHSILHHGLVSYFNKTSLFGEGTYLSIDATVCEGFATPGFAWRGADFEKLCCIAACEVVNHPQVRHGSRSREQSDASMGNALPPTYVVLQNNDHVRVSHLLVFTMNAKTAASRPWIVQNFCKLLLVVYALVVLFVGFSRTIWYKRIWQSEEL